MLDAGSHTRQARLQRLEGDTVGSPADSLAHPRAAFGDHRRVRSERARGRRHVDVDCLRVLREWREHADDGVRPIVHLEDAANHRPVTVEGTLPVVVRQQQRRWRPGAIVGIGQQPPQLRAHAEHRKVVRRDDRRRDALGRAIAVLTGRGQQDEPHRVQLGERVEPGSLAVVVELADRERAAARRPGAVMQDDELLRRGERQRPQEKRISDGKYRGVDPDGQGDGEDNGEGESRGRTERAQAVAHVFHRGVEAAPEPDVADVVLDAGDGAEGLLRGAARRGRRQAGARILRRQHVEVELQFEVELALDAGAVEHRPQAPPDAPRHHQACESTRATASAIRCQFSSSAASCFLPALVSS